MEVKTWRLWHCGCVMKQKAWTKEEGACSKEFAILEEYTIVGITFAYQRLIVKPLFIGAVVGSSEDVFEVSHQNNYAL